MTPIRKLLDNNKVFLLMLVWLAALLAAHLWPASYWLEVRKVIVGPARAGEPVPMIVDREISRPFLGAWTVTVRKWSEDGPVIYCTATGTSQYNTAADLPRDLTLDWWTNGKCPALSAGKYAIDTTWRIEPMLPFLPVKHVQRESNIFQVTP